MTTQKKLDKVAIKNNNIKNKWCSTGTMVSFIAGIKYNEKSMEILWC